MCVCTDCTCKWIGNAAYAVTARGKLAGVTNKWSVSHVSMGESLPFHSEALLLVLQGKHIDTYTVYIPYIKVMPRYFLLKLSYFLHKHQMKATKNAQAYTVGTHGCV